TLMRWDDPETYGVACKRLDCREHRSPYNSRRHAPAAFAELLASIPAPWLLVSVSDDGFHDVDGLGKLLAAIGYVERIDIDSKRYVGARIGIYNPSGEKVGTISRLRNRESLFVVGPDRGVVAAARGAGLAFLSKNGSAARKTVVTQAAAASGRNGASGAPIPVAEMSTQP